MQVRVEICRSCFRLTVLGMMLFYIKLALVAQWIEHLPPKERVTRSIRVEGTNRLRTQAIICNASAY